uniref:Uncharacterized protein n=1 Tax=Burkholderia phage vB_BgluM-SURPRISE13 TaxID=3159457 RepID=A0AAU7PFC9_9VIRU
MPGQIMLIEEVFYPLDEAIQKAAEQNVRRDFNLHLIGIKDFENLTQQDKDMYRAAAYDLLCKIGKNYVPNYPDFERICVEPEKVFYPLDEAVKAYADQLVQFDHDKGTIVGHTVDDLSESDRQIYLDVARRILEENGGTPRPYHPYKHIHIKK